MKTQTVWMWSLLSAVALLGACHPEDRCGEGLLLFEGTCHPCPANSTFEDGTCVCDQPDYYELRGKKCELINDAELPPMDAATDDNDAGEMPTATTCANYCDFVTTCVGDNSFASFLPAVVSGLHADDATMCTSACEGDVGGDGSEDTVVQCINAGREASMCTAEGQAGLTASFGLIGECCGGHADNALCQSICAALLADPNVGPNITFCD